MKKHLTRREILKLVSVLPLLYFLPPTMDGISLPILRKKYNNIIIVVFDAFSAWNISLYGYRRETTPNISRLADKATVYHNHYATANFTTPGTASLLTGTYPWTHRALNLYGRVKDIFKSQNLFALFKNHFRLVYTQNPVVSILLNQMDDYIDQYQPLGKLFLTYDSFIEQLFKNDLDTASIAWTRAVKSEETEFNYSLLYSQVYARQHDLQIQKIKQRFPHGVPSINKNNYFILEDIIDWTKEQVVKIPQPFLGYFHYLPPHEPYKTRKDFMGTFSNDSWPRVFNPNHRFPIPAFTPGVMIKNRTRYDEYILYVDSEFGRLYNSLEKSGILKNTWLILTSDHGEMFDRGIVGHGTPNLYQPLLQIPLLIFQPGQETRQDIYTPTSNVDLLPTLLKLTGQSIPDWCEGIILPPYNNNDFNRGDGIYALEARKTEKNSQLHTGTAAIVKDHYKLTYYFGYEELGKENQIIELHDVNDDPNEVNNISDSQPILTNQLLDELQTKLHATDATFAS
jgi:arylsulfatase A-like enzyme